MTGAMAASRAKVICTLACGPQTELQELAREPLEDFAARHGYDVVVEHALRAPERPASWSKVPLLRELLTEYETAVWVDADAIFVDTSLDIADAVDDDRFLGLVQHRYGGQDAINCGVLVLRSCPESLAFLDRVWSMTEFVDHAWWEQAAIMKLLGYRIDERPFAFSRLAAPTELFARVQVLSHEWNSISVDPAPRPRIKHYAGLPHERRRAGMRADLEEYRRRREAEVTPADFALSLVLPTAALGVATWDVVERIAALPDELSFEVVFIDDGSGRFDELLHGVDGDVSLIRGDRSLAASLDDAVEVARGATLLVLGTAAPLDLPWVEEIAALAARPDVPSAIRVTVTGAGGVLSAWAILRSELVALGGCRAFAPGAGDLAQICTALAQRGRTPLVVAYDAEAVASYAVG